MVGLVSRSEDLGLVDVVDFEGFERLGLGEMADPGLASTGMVTTAIMIAERAADLIRGRMPEPATAQHGNPELPKPV